MKSSALLCAAALLLSACSSAYKVPSRIDANLLREVPKARMQPITTALEGSAIARAAYDNARAQTRVSSDGVELALQELSVVTDRIGAARIDLASARREGAGPALDRAEAEYANLLGIGRIARLGLSLSRREHELAALRERLALEESRLADARVELARAIAVSELDVPAEQAVALEDVRDAVQFYEREVEIANRRLSDGRIRMTQARADYEAAIARESGGSVPPISAGT
ncbi:hypothetical protein Poly30_16270 [Planctomycetes bacterium Poly30]|uniref:Outer membrane efflux protein n=1 Tax=Saltatorellus ferox TaxID=2528018 RepID=A0A518EPV4_9BACT|nr:hypothetical protein Poly30_16270 [Planctomycetes bacterium Poly30]